MHYDRLAHIEKSHSQIKEESVDWEHVHKETQTKLALLQQESLGWDHMFKETQAKLALDEERVRNSLMISGLLYVSVHVKIWHEMLRASEVI